MSIPASPNPDGIRTLTYDALEIVMAQKYCWHNECLIFSLVLVVRIQAQFQVIWQPNLTFCNLLLQVVMDTPKCSGLEVNRTISKSRFHRDWLLSIASHPGGIKNRTLRDNLLSFQKEQIEFKIRIRTPTESEMKVEGHQTGFFWHPLYPMLLWVR